MPILTVTSGTPAAGTTTVATNLSVVLARSGRFVIILDLSPAPGPVAQRLGASRPGVRLAAGGLGDSGLVTVQPDGPYGLRIMATDPTAGPGVSRWTQSDPVVDAIRLLAAVADFVVIDVPTGHPARDAVSAASDRVLTVTGTSRESTGEAVRLIRHLHRLRTPTEIGVIVNGVAHPNEMGPVQRAVSAASAGRPGCPVECYGLVAADPQIPRAQMMQRAVVECRPRSTASRCFEALGRRVVQEVFPGGGGLSRVPDPGLPAPAPGPVELLRCA